MMMLPSSTRVFLWREPVDMRKGFDSLTALVRRQDLDVFSGDLFVFLSRRRDRVKILAWDSGGFLLWYKRLERTRFPRPVGDGDGGTAEIDAGQLALLLEGIDYSKLKRPRRWMPPTAA